MMHDAFIAGRFIHTQDGKMRNVFRACCRSCSWKGEEHANEPSRDTRLALAEREMKAHVLGSRTD